MFLFFAAHAPRPGRLVERASEDTMTAHCPECDNAIMIEKPLRGEIVVCSDCGTELEVVSENPFVLELAPQEEEDWGE
jgi:alpha-aminoadipate/glutamate carrier protein LysW